MGFTGDSDSKESACNSGDLVRSPSWEDPLEEEMPTQSSILAWRIPWTEEPGGLQSMGSQRVGHDWVTKHIQQGVDVKASSPSSSHPLLPAMSTGPFSVSVSLFLPWK